MKKILYVTTIAGFLSQFEMNDVAIVQDMGYEVHYASNFNNPIYAFDVKDLHEKGIITHHIDIEKSPASFLSNIKAIKQIKQIIDSENINLVHCHNPMGAVCARVAAATSENHPLVIYTAHGLHFYKGAPVLNWLAYYPVEKVLAHCTDALITINSEDYERVNKSFHLKNDGFVSQIHGVGVDTNRFSEKKQINITKRKELGIPEGAFHIVTAAELNDNKNQKVIIDAIHRLQDENIYYSICGKGPNYKALKERIKQYGLESQIRLLDYRTDMDEILQTADLFAFPSIREGLGIAAVEALLCGVPILAADNRGTREYVHNGVNGFRVKADAVQEYADYLKRLIDDTEYRMALAAQCRKSVEKFGIEETNRIMKEVYRKIDKKLL